MLVVKKIKNEILSLQKFYLPLYQSQDNIHKKRLFKLKEINHALTILKESIKLFFFEQIFVLQDQYNLINGKKKSIN